MQTQRQPGARIAAALWLGCPQTPEEHRALYRSLRAEVRTQHPKPGPIEVFDGPAMPVERLLRVFTKDERFIAGTVERARTLGIHEASMGVLFFPGDAEPLWKDHAPEGGLAYLGVFEFPAADAYTD